jgi:FkbM family methyltransferase
MKNNVLLNLVLRKKMRANRFARIIKSYAARLSSDSADAHKKLMLLVAELGIETIIDIGANVGQFGIDIRNAGFKGQIISYEPIGSIFEDLKKTSEKFPPWKVFKEGLGEAGSYEKINISGNDGLSSSFLEMKDVHLKNFPNSKFVGSEFVKITTLDDEINRMDIDPTKVLLKIDAQGFEAYVLKGAQKNLAKIPLSYIELSLYPLYENEKPFLVILNFLDTRGHQLVEIFRGVRALNGDLLQVDIITKNI